MRTGLANAFVEIVSIFTLNASRLIALLVLAVLDKAALFTLPVAYEETFLAFGASSSSASLTIWAEARLAPDTLSIKTKVALSALLALESILTLLTINVYVVGTRATETIFDE